MGVRRATTVVAKVSILVAKIDLKENSIVAVCFYDHLITLSALASTFCGIVRPICFAVLRFITSSNFVDCSTG